MKPLLTLVLIFSISAYSQLPKKLKFQTNIPDSVKIDSLNKLSADLWYSNPELGVLYAQQALDLSLKKSSFIEK